MKIIIIKIRSLILSILIGPCLVAPVFALDAPSLYLKTAGLDVSLSWTPVPDASAYRIYYAPYPYSGPDTIGSLDMADATDFFIKLWDGVSYYVAIRARNASAESGFSNIELFKLDGTPRCSAENPQLCLTETKCIVDGSSYWWSDNTCHSLPFESKDLLSIRLDKEKGEGFVSFHRDGFDAAANISVKTVEPILLGDNLEAVGNAYLISVDPEPSLPALVSIPVPDGQDGSHLALLRIEDDGRKTLLQTRMENGNLLAVSPGFSTIVPVRLKELLNDYNAEISGPEVIPVNFDAQYREIGNSLGIPGLHRHWTVYEYPKTGMKSELNADESNPLLNNVAFLAAENPGMLQLTVEMTDPVTGINKFASKYISVLDDLDASDLQIAVYAPSVVTEDEPFDIQGVIMNTGNREIKHWIWKIGGLSDIQEGNNQDLELNLLILKDPGSYKLTLIAETTDGDSGKAVVPIRVLDKKVHILSIEGKQDYVFPSFAGSVDIAFKAFVAGGKPGYQYIWTMIPGDSQTNTTSATSNSFTSSLSEQGEYLLKLEVIDANGMRDERFQTLTVQPDPLNPLLLTNAINNVPTQIGVGQVFNIELQASGGILIHGGQRYPAYDYAVDWSGEGCLDYPQFLSNTFNEKNNAPALSAESVKEGGKVSLSHCYTQPGTYTIKFAATLPWRYLESDIATTTAIIEVVACDAGHLNACASENECSTVGGLWSNNSCAAAECGASHLDICKTESTCFSAGGAWADNSCNEAGFPDESVCPKNIEENIGVFSANYVPRSFKEFVISGYLGQCHYNDSGAEIAVYFSPGSPYTLSAPNGACDGLGDPQFLNSTVRTVGVLGSSSIKNIIDLLESALATAVAQHAGKKCAE